MNCIRLRCFGLVAGILLLSSAAQASQIDIVGPPGSGQFGWSVKVLPNGNFVVTDPEYSIPGGASRVGAVYLYSPSRTLISTLRGSSPDDQVGNAGITIVGDGNFVVGSSNWNNGAAAKAGAQTWCNGITGVSGVVSAANSQVGTYAGDRVGGNVVTVLPNGNYVVRNTLWKNQTGAVTWCNGNTGIVGEISAANSLVGSVPNDNVGSGTHQRILNNGNYVISSPEWNNGAVHNVGAVTWADSNAPITGTVSALNSLIGSTTDDRIGRFGITALSNGNYVVASWEWDNGGVYNAGAVTWCNGSIGTVGTISSSNSLVGDSYNDCVGKDGVFALSNGDYVVCSSLWDNGDINDAGAATWGSGTFGVSGPISNANALIGTVQGDNVGVGGVTGLTNGNYVVNSYNWKNGTNSPYGAVTWARGGSAILGEISADNSLVGGSKSDQVGRSGVFALTNGNYIVCSYFWDNGTISNVGAATWCDGATGRAGLVSPENSLVGSVAQDEVGIDGAIALGNGNYVVCSGNWGNGTQPQSGAVTWGDGASGIIGEVSPANSLVGSSIYDKVGDRNVYALNDESYVVVNSLWDNNGIVDAGAITWCDGSAATAGVVSPANSLVGATRSDRIGNGGIVKLTDGNYVIRSSYWINAGVSNAGALTWVDGSKPIIGTVSPANSLVGATADDQIGGGNPLDVIAIGGGGYIAGDWFWNNGALVDAGAVSWCMPGGVTVGVVTPENSVLCLVAQSGTFLDFEFNEAQQKLFVKRVAENMVTIFRPGHNNQPPEIASAGPFSIAENSADGALIASLAATDPDGDALAFSIAGGNSSGAFEIDSMSGALTVHDSTKLDFESVPGHKFDLTISVSDGEFSASATITINLTDVNEPPAIAPAGPFTLAENSANGTAVGTVAASDPDAGATLSFSISAGNAEGAFAINTVSGTMTVADSSKLDYETVPGHKFDLTVTVSDGTFDDSTTVTINLTGEDEFPIIEASISFTLPENSANGTVVGAVPASDPEGAALEYSITGGNSNGAFAIDAASGEITVANASLLNFETVPGHKFDLTITVSDGANDSFTLVTITLSDVNEAPAALDGILEVSGTAATPGQLAASDPEAATLTYSIVGNPGKGIVTLNPATGAFTYTAGANAANTDAFTFQASDGVFDSNIATVNITINFANAAPVMASPPEAAPNPAYVGTAITFTAAASDADGDTLAYTWDFKDGNTGSGASVQHTFSAAGTYQVDVTVSDGQVSVSATVEVTVLPAKVATVSKGAVKFNFAAAGKDSFALSGTLNLQPGFVIAGKQLDISIVDFTQTGLIFNSKNTATSGKTLSFKITAKTDKKTGAVIAPLAKYALSIKNESLFEALKRAGFVNDDVKNLSVPVVATFKIDGVPCEAHKTFIYSAKKNKSGSGK